MDVGGLDINVPFFLSFYTFSYQVVISPGLIEKMEATIEAELLEEDEGKIYTAADLFRLPVS